MQESKKQTVSVDEKRAIVTMAETFRLEGHSNYLQKTSEATGVSHRRVVRYLEEWRKSKDEAGEIEVLNFMEDE